jgi:hypothetical protein
MGLRFLDKANLFRGYLNVDSVYHTLGILGFHFFLSFLRNLANNRASSLIKVS